MKAARGFTLLEVLLATFIMAVAVTGLLSNLNTSLRNAGRLTDAERAASLARRQLDLLLAEGDLPSGRLIQGEFAPGLLGDGEARWRAVTSVFETRPQAATGEVVLQRIEVEVEWSRAGRSRSFRLETYRRKRLTPADTMEAPRL